MRDFLIYGASTPLGARLCWYLSTYGKHRDMTINLRRVAQGPEHMGELQDDVWGQMIGERINRPDCIVNCHSISPKVMASNTSLGWTKGTMVPTMIALAARAARIPYVQISTDRVFSGRSGPYSPADRPGPSDLFGAAHMYGEQFIQKLYPPEVTTTASTADLAGAFVVRISSLFGYDVYNDVRTVVSQGRGLATGTLESPSFIGEVAFLLARNLLESPASLMREEGRPVHIAAKVDNTSMFTMLRASGFAAEVRDEYPLSFGLVPTPGWVLSSGRHGVWSDFLKEMKANEYMRYW